MEVKTNLRYSCSRNESEDFESWYGSCFEPMSPPDITLDELLPSLLVYRSAPVPQSNLTKECQCFAV